MNPRQDVQQRICGLYGIACAGSPGGDPLHWVHALLQGGCRLVQLRCKGWSDDDLLLAAQSARTACHAVGATFIVNDRAQVAAAVDADGVHVGQLDGPESAIRAELGSTRILGRSTHSPADLASSSADYVAFGPVFSTPRLSWDKPQQNLDTLRLARQLAGSRPLVAIGGITAERLADVRACGANAWAVIGAVSLADNPVQATRSLLS